MNEARNGKVLLEAQHVCKYFGGLKAVEDVNMQICEGDIFGIIGPNGAGKTTFFNMCTGMYPVTKGKILFEGTDITTMSTENIAEKYISRTFQNIQLFKYMTVLENVMVGCHSRTKSGLFSSIFRTPAQRREEKAVVKKCRDILEFMDLGDKADFLASNLSYGEQRRLEISRALASDPKMILLDEPAAGMNGAEKEELQRTIRKIADKGITVLLVEHDMKLVMNVTHQICVISFGKRIGYGTPEEIQQNPDVIEAYLGGGLDV